MDSKIILKDKSGYTLVELSVVIIIIGLIISSVLYGIDIVKTAEAKMILSQIERINNNIYTFVEKYKSYPGDYNQAATYIDSSCTNGDSNGLVATGVPGAEPTTISSEMAQVWYHLYKSNIMPGGFTGTSTTTSLGNTGNFPLLDNNKGGVLIYGSPTYVNYMFLGLANNSSNTNISTNTVLTPNQALIIDNKIDDGLPQSGKVMAYNSPSTATSAVAGASSTCVVTGGYYYTIGTANNYNCSLRIKIGFEN